VHDASQSLHRRTSRRWIIGLGVGLPLVGCANWGLHEPLQVIVVGIDALPSEGMEMRLAVKLRVQNPNDAALDFDGVSMTLEVRGSTFASGVSEARGSVPRFGETLITVPVSISALAAIRQLIGLATTEQPRLDYVLRGRLSGTAFGGMRFESKGQLEMPKGTGLD
jgi:hypothetical protein